MTTSPSENGANNLENEKKFEKTKVQAQKSVKAFFSELLDIRSETDWDSTIESVQKDISFKGHNAWILIFSIFVASIGLNVSSTAVVIGAMLISPLMGPIVGVGLSVAINAVDMLRRSLINLGVMIGLSVITAFLYFKVSPLTEETPELVARTYPTILDVLVAIFGGLALIVARTKSGTIASVIFGVAIATALMPPLCTVGYGLAIGNFTYAGGAFYLFSINAVFIALSTFIVAKVLRFPLVKYANSRRRRFIARMASLIALVVMVPSVILFYNLLKEQLFDKQAKTFVREVVDYEGTEVVKEQFNYDSKTIEVYLIGRPVPPDIIGQWKESMTKMEPLRDVDLFIYQGADRSGELAEQISSSLKSDILEELYVNNEQKLRDQQSKIEFLENEVARMSTQRIPFQMVSSEAKLNYRELTSFSYSDKLISNFSRIDTIPYFEVSWDKGLRRSERNENNKRLAEWLKFRLKLDTLVIAEAN